MSEELSAKDQLDFAYIYGTLFSLSTSVEYLQAIQGIMGERKANHAKNKARDAEVACQVVYNTLEREVTKRMLPEQKAIAMAAIEHHKELIYSFFLLDADDQRRVKSLITKINSKKS